MFVCIVRWRLSSGAFVSILQTYCRHLHFLTVLPLLELPRNGVHLSYFYPISQGCDDGYVRQYDVRAGRRPVRHIRIGSSPITALTVDTEGKFAMAGNFDFELASLHLSSASIMISTAVPFRPRALAFTNGTFYAGGSDRIDDPSRCLLRLDFACRVLGSTPVSARSVYTIAVHPKSGALAAAGYAPDFVDVYIDPPVRSFSIDV